MKKRGFQQVLPLVSAILASVVGGVAFVSVSSNVQDLIRSHLIDTRAQKLENEREKKVENEIADLRNKIAINRDDFANILDRVNKKIDDLPTDAQARALVARFDEKLDTMSSRLGALEKANLQDPQLVSNLNEKVSSPSDRFKKLEDAIVSDPAKAISILMATKELESLRKSVDDKTSAQNAAIDKVYNILFGSIFVIAVSIVTQSLSSFFASRRQAETNRTSRSGS